MCIVSEKVAFCTCVNGSVDELEHYWVLYRFTKAKQKYIIVGQPVMPPGFLEVDLMQTETILEKRINEPDAFDIPLVCKPKDQLTIVLHNHAVKAGKRVVFTFTYQRKKWVLDYSFPFEHEGEYQEMKFGKLIPG